MHSCYVFHTQHANSLLLLIHVQVQCDLAITRNTCVNICSLNCLNLFLKYKIGQTCLVCVCFGWTGCSVSTFICESLCLIRKKKKSIFYQFISLDLLLFLNSIRISLLQLFGGNMLRVVLRAYMLIGSMLEQLACCIHLFVFFLLEKLLFFKLNSFLIDPRQILFNRGPPSSCLDRSYRNFDLSSFLEFVSIAS